MKNYFKNLSQGTASPATYPKIRYIFQYKYPDFVFSLHV